MIQDYFLIIWRCDIFFYCYHFFSIQTENYKGMVKVLFNMYPIMDHCSSGSWSNWGRNHSFSINQKSIHICNRRCIDKHYWLVLQFVQKLKKIDHGRQSRQFVLWIHDLTSRWWNFFFYFDCLYLQCNVCNVKEVGKS